MSNLPCPWRHCRCTHTEGCVAGWLEDGRPCPTCRPEVAHALRTWSPRLEADGKPSLADGVQRSAMLRALKRPSRRPPPEHEDDDGWSPSRVLTR